MNDTSMLVAIHQPHYLPWLRYFEKIARADVFILLDTVQFTKNDWQNRNKIKTAAGPTVLTVPVHAKLGQPLKDIRIDNSAPWRKKHASTLRQSYAKAPFFDLVCPLVERTYSREWTFLNELNRSMLDGVLELLGVGTRVVAASEFDVDGEATERLVNLIEAVGGRRYYSGAYAAEAYLDVDLFARAGIGLELQHWQAPTYSQLHGPFIPDLAILDLLMNCGPNALPILMRGAE